MCVIKVNKRKFQREVPGFSDKILSMYARGMTNREISEHLKAWRKRDLENGHVANRSIHLALAINLKGPAFRRNRFRNCPHHAI